jgi:thiol-disulfide isomerase/thioredoxin
MMVVITSGMIRAQEKKQDSASQPDASSQKDPFTVPEGNAGELLEYIEELQNRQPPESTRDEARAFQRKQYEAIVKAAEKAMAADPNEEQLERAAAEKAMALGHLSRLDEKYAKQLEQFPAELAKAGHPELAREMRAFLLQRELMQLRDPKPEALGKFLDRVQQFLSEGEIDAEEIRLAIGTARAMESLGDKEMAAKAYREFGKILAKSEEEAIADIGEKMQGSARRLDLVGNKMELEGITMEGDPIDWSKYRDKVTLVMFWATWCGPCRREITEVKEIYDEYHDRGFEVIGISVDEDREQLEEFLKENEIPWTIVYDQALADGEKGQPMSTRYGVMAIPETILVDREGKVVATELRGPRLEERLKEMVGSAEEAKEKTEKKG